MHELGNGSRVVPPVQVQQINIRGLKSHKRVVNRDAKGFGAVATKVGLDLLLLVFPVGAREFGGNNHLIAVLT